MSQSLQDTLSPVRAGASRARGPAPRRVADSTADKERTGTAQPPRSKNEASSRPFWLSEDRPLWCTHTHRDSELYDDRVHGFSRPGAPIALSLHEPWYVPAQTAAAGVAARLDAAGPVHVDVSALWHCRHREPEVELAVPTFDEQDRPVGETGVRLSVSEARALRDVLTQVFVTLQVSVPAVFDASEPSAHEPTIAEPVEVVIFEGADECARLASALVWWPGERIEVQLNVTDIPVACTAEQAREAAARLRAFADIVDAHAALAASRQVAA